jgi:hypothetical protein
VAQVFHSHVHQLQLITVLIQYFQLLHQRVAVVDQHVVLMSHHPLVETQEKLVDQVVAQVNGQTQITLALVVQEILHP